MDYQEKILNAKSVGQLFNLVKKIVKEYTGLQKSGINFYLEDIEIYNGHFIGGYYNYRLNKLSVNKIPLKILIGKNAEFHNFYLFHILLHEYIHAVGFTNEFKTRKMVYDISRDCFGEQHLLTRFALNLGNFLPSIFPAPEQIIVNKPRSYSSVITPGIEMDFFEGFDNLIQSQFRDMTKIFRRFVI